MPRGIKYISTTVLHPGSTLAEKLEELELSPQDFAKQINFEEEIILEIVEEKDMGVVTPDLAEAFEKKLKIPAEFWLRKQKRYSEFIAKQKPHQGVVYNPTKVIHPGARLAEELQGRGLFPKDFAEQIGVDLGVIINLVMESQEESITPELAEIFGKALDIPAQYWLNRQKNYDEALARQQAIQTT